MQNSIYPKLRQVDFFPAEVSDQKVVCLRDPFNLNDKVLMFPYPAFFILTLFDGRHSLVDIQAEFMRRFGEILFQEKILEIIKVLEAHYLLDDERFQRRHGEIVAAFRKAPLRSMALAGQAYDQDPVKLQQEIESFFSHPEGPGGALPPEGIAGSLAGLVAPHIDFRRGGPCYAWAHQVIRQVPPPQVFVILGTAHAGIRLPYALTAKSFDTPWGPVETDREMLDEITRRCAFDFFEDEFAHKAEHSIELQLTFLRSQWRAQDKFRILPVLCGSFHEAVLAGKSPLDFPEIRSFITALRTAAAGSQRKICLLASADLAHMGLRFGDAMAPSRFDLEALGGDDRRMLGHAERVDAESFFEDVSREKDRRRICGLSAVYTLLQTVGARTGRVLNYNQSADPASGSVVSFASLAFFS
jgi:MEMO1 family protein